MRKIGVLVYVNTSTGTGVADAATKAVPAQAFGAALAALGVVPVVEQHRRQQRGSDY